MNITNKDLKKRILDISYKYKLSHVGSCLTAVDIIKEIYDTKRKDERFVLSSGHAGLALYCILEAVEHKDAEKIWLHHGVHPDRCSKCGLDCSTGSLGQGLPIAVGMALADRTKNVYCLVSDGEIAEGSIWEAIRIIHDNKIDNLKLYVNWNGYGAYDQSSRWAYATLIGDPLIEFRETKEELPFLKKLDAHYHVMNEEEYKEGMEILKDCFCIEDPKGTFLVVHDCPKHKPMLR